MNRSAERRLRRNLGDRFSGVDLSTADEKLGELEARRDKWRREERLHRVGGVARDKFKNGAPVNFHYAPDHAQAAKYARLAETIESFIAQVVEAFGVEASAAALRAAAVLLAATCEPTPPRLAGRGNAGPAPPRRSAVNADRAPPLALRPDDGALGRRLLEVAV